MMEDQVALGSGNSFGSDSLASRVNAAPFVPGAHGIHRSAQFGVNAKPFVPATLVQSHSSNSLRAEFAQAPPFVPAGNGAS